MASAQNLFSSFDAKNRPRARTRNYFMKFSATPLLSGACGGLVANHILFIIANCITAAERLSLAPSRQMVTNFKSLIFSDVFFALFKSGGYIWLPAHEIDTSLYGAVVYKYNWIVTVSKRPLCYFFTFVYVAKLDRATLMLKLGGTGFQLVFEMEHGTQSISFIILLWNWGI